MVKRSIEQDIRNKNFGARNGNYERNAVVKNHETKQRGQRILGDCWQWEANGQCSRGDNCSFRHDINKRAKMTQPNPSPNSFMQQNERNASRTRSHRGRSPSCRMSRWPCKEYLKGTCTNSFCEKWHPPECLFYKTKSGCRFGEKCSHAHCQVDEQLSKTFKKNDDKSAVSMLKIHNNWVAYVKIWSRRSLNRFCGRAQTCGNQSDVLNSQAVVRHADIRDHNPSLGMICPGDPHQRNPNAPKFEDRSEEETEWSYRVFNYLHDSNSIFGPGELTQNEFRAARYRWSHENNCSTCAGSHRRFCVQLLLEIFMSQYIVCRWISSSGCVLSNMFMFRHTDGRRWQSCGNGHLSSSGGH